MCDETCQTCNGSEISDCITCFDGFDFNDGVCDEREGRHCDTKCKECVQGSTDRCSSCNEGRFLLGVECVSRCPSDYFTNEEKSE